MQIQAETKQSRGEEKGIFITTSNVNDVCKIVYDNCYTNQKLYEFV